MRNEVMKALEKRLELWFYWGGHPGISKQLDVFLLIFFSHDDVSASLNKLFSL